MRSDEWSPKTHQYLSSPQSHPAARASLAGKGLFLGKAGVLSSVYVAYRMGMVN